MLQRDGIIIECYQMPEAELAEIRSRGSGHIDHIAFDVDDIDETFNTVKAAGFDIPRRKTNLFLLSGNREQNSFYYRPGWRKAGV